LQEHKIQIESISKSTMKSMNKSIVGLVGL